MSRSTTVDQRSIGELLLDADFQARQLLLDVDGADACAMLRTWGEVVQAAGELWSSLPATPFSGPLDGVTMQRLEAMSQAQHRAQLARDWPGDGQPDERLLGIAGAHAVGVAVYQHVAEVRAVVDRHTSARASRDIPRGQDAATRIAAFEQLVGGYVGNRFGPSMAGQRYTPPRGTERLNQALVSWEVQAHRTLAVAPSAPNLHLIAGTQATIATASTAILDAAVSAGRAARTTTSTGSHPHWAPTNSRWAKTANRWGTLSSRGERADPTLVHAANEVRAAVHEIAIDRTRWATPEVMAGRVDLAEAALTVQQATIAAAELACAHRDVVEQEPDLKGSARTIAAWIRGGGEPQAGRRGGSSVYDEIALVSPSDIYANRAVKLPGIVRRSLVADAAELVDASGTAMYATTCSGVVPAHVPQGTDYPRRRAADARTPVAQSTRSAGRS